MGPVKAAPKGSGTATERDRVARATPARVAALVRVAVASADGKDAALLIKLQDANADMPCEDVLRLNFA